MQASKTIIRIPNWLGDAVMATAAIEMYRNQAQDEEVYLFGIPQSLDVFSHQFNEHFLIPYDRKGEDRGWKGFRHVIQRLGEYHFDRGYLLTNSFSSALLFRLAGIRERTGYAGQSRTWMLSQAVSPDKHLHQAEQYAYLFFNQIPENLETRIVISEAEKEWARAWLGKNGIHQKKMIGFAVGAAYGPAKRWPVERFAELASLCSRELDAHVLLFGAKNEQVIIDRIKNHIQEGIVDCGGTTLREFFALMNQCQVVVANDSGAMHAAAAIGVPVVAIFGSTNPIATGPIGQQISIVTQKIDCAPCFKRTCPYEHYECLKRIEAKHVFERIKSLLVV